MSVIRTQRLTTADHDTARALFALMEEVFENGHQPLSDVYIAGLLGRVDLWVFAAFIDDTLAGGITGHTLPMTRSESSEIFIYDLAVRADLQRRGVGRALVARLRADAAAAGIDDVFVPADDEDEHAIDFYRALGGEASPVTFFTFGRRPDVARRGTSQTSDPLASSTARHALEVGIAHADEFPAVLSIDDDATRLYAAGGVVLGLTETSPFVVAEQVRWAAATRAGRTIMAFDDAGDPIGVAVLGMIDGEPYLDQLSVRLTAMRRGVGRALVEAACAWAHDHGGRLWLNTYGHLDWNQPYYERLGFVPVAEEAWRPEMRAVVASQRAALPHPEKRVVMYRDCSG